ncbi:MAG: hypothetical protein M3Y34_07360 [Actinomycetota bacterium]|nr:hypothetical protein [Actinomycetota bacterium]
MSLAATGDRSVKVEDFRVEPGKVTAGEVSCPRGAEPTGGGFSVQPLSATDIGTRVNEASFSRHDHWTTRINAFGTETRKAKSIAICRANAGNLSRKSKSIGVDGSFDQWPSVSIRCPKGSSLTGGGAEVSGGYQDMYVLESRPSGNREWVVTAFVSVGYVGSLEAHAACDPENRNDYKTVVDFTSVMRARRGTVIERQAKAECPAGAVTTGGGYSLGESQNVMVTDNRPKGNDAWLLRLRTHQSGQTYSAWARCLK